MEVGMGGRCTQGKGFDTRGAFDGIDDARRSIRPAHFAKEADKPKQAVHPHVHGGCNRGKGCKLIECERCFCRECFRALCETAKYGRKRRKENKKYKGEASHD